ncbi:MAG: hypothetical protein ACREU7_04725 [Burkholderiales bacterium]
MSEIEGRRGEAAAYEKPLGENTFLRFVQQPRILLVLLAAWEIVGFLTELFTSNALFLENHAAGEISLDGVFGGRAFGWEAVPLAVLYLYCARDPQRFRGVFWLALVEQGAAITSYFYHWLVSDDFSFESVAIPMAGSATLGLFVFLHLFQPRDSQGQRG